MNLRRALRLFTQRDQSTTSPISPATPEETRQLDLLLEELRANEQQLSRGYWSTKARAFAEKMAFHEATENVRRASRFSQIKPYFASLLPIGGLLALGLSFSGPRVESTSALVADESTSSNALPSNIIDVSVMLPIGEAQLEAAPLLSPESHQLASHRPAQAEKRLTLRTASARPNPTPSALVGNAPEVTTPTAAPNTTPLVATTAAKVSSGPDTFTEQLQALRRADKALKNGDTSIAKNALTRDFSPQLVLHANALRAVLACQIHDTLTGKRYLDSQARHYPNSPYLDRMRRACRVNRSSNQ